MAIKVEFTKKGTINKQLIDKGTILTVSESICEDLVNVQKCAKKVDGGGAKSGAKGSNAKSDAEKAGK